MTQLGVNPAQILKAAEEGLNVLPKVTGGEQTISPELEPGASTPPQAEAERMKDQYVSVEHLLLGLVKVKSKAQDAARAPWGSTRRRSSRRSRRSAAASG